ncbi:MAG: hypothetical protein L0Y44_16540 [Phycisphaerales bacterium]|nr:hypothetical protein [Phycisphaerales bacterium]MCI0632253.1 hypothetical protein [Phycisphaerales bacterium]MCI0676963.1 hypothetical protein [Phycisphaerales bacterium]
MADPAHFGVRTSLVMGLALTTLQASTSLGVEPPDARASIKAPDHQFKRVDLVVQPSMFDSIIEHLRLDQEQITAARAHHRAYFEEACELDALVAQRVDDAGLREAGELSTAARQRGQPIPLGKMRVLRNAWRPEMIAGLKKADALLDAFYANLAAVLREDQLTRFSEVPALVRRLNIDVRHAELEGKGSVQGEFSYEIRPADLVADASKEGCEFYDAHEGFLVALHDILYRHEQTVDGFRVEDLRDRRTPVPEDQSLTYSRFDARGQANVRKWRERFGALRRYCDEIAAAAEQHLAVERANQWRERFLRAICPSVFEEAWPDRMLDWLKARTDVQPEQLEAAVVLMEAYPAERDRLRLAAIEAGIQSRGQPGSEAAAEAAEFRYGKALWRMVQQNEQVTRGFRALLTVDQARDFDRTLASLRDYQPNLNIMGPYVKPEIRERITGEHLPRGILVGPVNPDTGEQTIIDLEKQGVPWYEIDESE